MEKRYIIGIDQSTQGTKALLFDGEGHLLRRTDLPHRQIVNEKGWVSHDLNEIYRNTVQTVKTLVAESGVAPEEIAGIGISNQRETTAIWDKATGELLQRWHGCFETAEKKDRNVLQTGNSAWVRLTAGWFTS